MSYVLCPTSLPQRLQVDPAVRHIDEGMEGERQIPTDPTVLAKVRLRVCADDDRQLWQCGAPVKPRDAAGMLRDTESLRRRRDQEQIGDRGRRTEQPQRFPLALKDRDGPVAVVVEEASEETGRNDPSRGIVEPQGPGLRIDLDVRLTENRAT